MRGPSLAIRSVCLPLPIRGRLFFRLRYLRLKETARDLVGQACCRLIDLAKGSPYWGKSLLQVSLPPFGEASTLSTHSATSPTGAEMSRCTPQSGNGITRDSKRLRNLGEPQRELDKITKQCSHPRAVMQIAVGVGDVC